MSEPNVIPLPWIPPLEFGDRLRLVRLAYGDRLGRTFTQEEFAELIGAPGGTYSTWEARSKPRDILKIAKAVAALTDCDELWLLGLRAQAGPPDQGIPTSQAM